MAEAARLDELADSLPPPAAAEASGDDLDIADTVTPAEAEPPSSSEPDPLDRLLSEWDERNGAGNGAAPSDDDIIAALDAANQQAAREQEFQTFQAQAAQQQADASIAAAQRDRQIGELQQTVGQLQQAIAQEVARQHQQRSAADFERLAANEQAKLEGLHVDENHVKRWLLSEAAEDPQLREAWEARYYQPPGPLDRARVAADIHRWAEGQAKLALQLADPRARLLAQQNIEASMRQMWETAFPDPAAYRANADRYVRKAIDRMHKGARRPRIDERISGDVLAVAAAVRGASGKVPPEPAPNWGELSDAALNAFTKRLGFRAI